MQLVREDREVELEHERVIRERAEVGRRRRRLDDLARGQRDEHERGGQRGARHSRGFEITPNIASTTSATSTTATAPST